MHRPWRLSQIVRQSSVDAANLSDCRNKSFVMLGETQGRRFCGVFYLQLVIVGFPLMLLHIDGNGKKHSGTRSASRLFSHNEWTLILEVIQKGDAAAASAALGISADYTARRSANFSAPGCRFGTGGGIHAEFFRPGHLNHGTAELVFGTRRKAGGWEVSQFPLPCVWLHLQDEWRGKSAVTKGRTGENSLFRPPTFQLRNLRSFVWDFWPDLDRELALEIIPRPPRARAIRNTRSTSARGNDAGGGGTRTGMNEMPSRGASTGFVSGYRATFGEVSKLVGPDEVEVRPRCLLIRYFRRRL